MRALLLFAVALTALAPTASGQEVTGLSDWTLYLDPGHSGTDENVGIYGYSEPQKVLRVALALRDMLETRTDIEAVYTSRDDDSDQVSLSQRSDEANALGVDFFHSIHSNAGGASTNNTLMLYGGWRQNGQTVEKTPMGGRRMGDLYVVDLTAAMRIPTIGNFADRTFYQGFPENHANQFPYLSVNRRTNMASVLSEGGFHTNPRQNTLNMNADWKVLEAQAHFWAILEYHDLPRTPDRIATGIISDVETGTPINGATITIAGETYTTDTYESLFNRYTNDPDLLHNGFYYLPDMADGTHAVTVEAPDYAAFTGSVTMLEGEFTFYDVSLVTTIPPVVEASDPEDGQDPFRITDPITVDFSRPMDRPSTEAAFALTEAGTPVSGVFSWEDGDTRLVFSPDAPLEPLTSFDLTIAETATAQAGGAIDGDGDGTGGDAFAITFTTGIADVEPPRIATVSPANNSTGVERLPILTLTYTEPVDPATVEGRVSLVPSEGGDALSGEVQYRRLGEVGVLSFFPAELLDANTTYRLEVAPGLRDLFSNEQTQLQRLTFTTGAQTAVPTSIDDFEGDVADNWWLPPQRSGSTTGINPDSTDSFTTTDLASLLRGGETSLRVDYGWNVIDGSPWLIRQYLESGPPQSVRFTEDATLRVALFGDGSGTLFRFAVRDSGPSPNLDVSPWTPVDWVGWREVTWDIDVDGTGTWIGNGTVDGSAYIDSIQLTYDAAAPSAEFGQLWFDDLQVVSFVSTDSEGAPERAFALGEAFPNPVRQRATVRLTLPEPTAVTATVYSATGAEVARLATGATMAAGEHPLEWDASAVASGVYFVRVTAGGETATARLTVVR